MTSYSIRADGSLWTVMHAGSGTATYPVPFETALRQAHELISRGISVMALRELGAESSMSAEEIFAELRESGLG
jgi:hypothetical protein